MIKTDLILDGFNQEGIHKRTGSKYNEYGWDAERLQCKRI